VKDPLRGVKFRVIPMGCRTNLFECEALCCSFVESGAARSETKDFDVAVLVGCSVTSEADRKCRQILRRLRREKKDALIIAAGCWAQKATIEEAAGLGVDCLVGNRLKHRIPAIVREMLLSGRRTEQPRIEMVDVSNFSGWEDLRLLRPQTRTRAFVKIQDGCDHGCSYCIIPALRGKGVERDPLDVLQEVERIALSGCREVVFTGINLGVYGRNSGMPLGELVKRSGDIEGIARIRFGSLEPFAVTETLLGDLSATAQFCPHFHLPLQSGDPDILRLMRRGYTPEDFLAHVEMARSFFGEDLHISTDIIVGFPGESEDAFDRTLSLLVSAGTGRLHVFPFSSRDGTVAASIPGRLKGPEIRSRVERSIALGKDLLDSYSGKWIGKRVDLLVEGRTGGMMEGFSSHYVRVECPGDSEPGMIRSVFVTDSLDGVLRAVV
jgi:threonylcarbamoyladenosine tRNA methylthiotransferase MtaB